MIKYVVVNNNCMLRVLSPEKSLNGLSRLCGVFLRSCKSAMSRSCVVASGLKKLWWESCHVGTYLCQIWNKLVMEAPFRVSVLHPRWETSISGLQTSSTFSSALDKLRKTFIPKKDVRCVVPQFCGQPHRNHTSNSPVDLLTPKVLPSCSILCFDRAKLLCSIVPCRTSRLNCNSSRWPGIELKGSRSHRFAILVSSHSGFHCVPAPRVTGCHSFAPSRAAARWGAARSPKKTPVNSIVAAPRMQKGLLICCVLAVQKQVQYQMRKIGVEVALPRCHMVSCQSHLCFFCLILSLSSQLLL